MPFLGKTPSQIVDPEVDIDGGTIDGVSIGSVTANAGAFTNLTATGTLTLPDDGISGDDVNGGTISNFASTGIDDNATSTAITIDSSQRVGIGSASPSEQLHIANANDAVVLIESTGSDATDDANIQLKTTNGTFTLQNDRSLGTTGALTVAGATSNNIVVDHTSGNVGIGTGSPSTPLHVEKNTGTGGYAAGFIRNTSTTGQGNGLVVDVTNTPHTYIADFRIGNTSKVRIDTSSNVGIGTSSPNNKGRLAVSSGSGNTDIPSLYLNQRSSASDLSKGIAFGIDGGVYGRIISGHSGSGGAMAFHTGTANSPPERMRIDSSGNVSIGTSSTTNALFKTDIKGSSTGNFQALRLFNSSDGASATTDLSFCLNRVGSEVLGVAGSIKAGKEQTWTTTPSTVDGYLSFSTVLDETPAERMRISSSGNVGIGSSGPSQKLHVEGGDVLIKSEYNATGTTDALIYFASRTSGNWRNAHIGQSGNALVFATGGTGTTHTNGAERVRIDGSGNLLTGSFDSSLVGSSTGYGVVIRTANAEHVFARNSTHGAIYVNKTGYTSGSTYFMTWRTNGSSERGHIYWNGTSMQYSSQSDQRLKQNIQDSGSAISDVMASQVRSFDWIESGIHQKYGFVAQELAEVAPEAVGIPEDEEDMWNIDVSKLVPMLTKAIQEQQAIIEDLQTRLSALEAN